MDVLVVLSISAPDNKTKLKNCMARQTCFLISFFIFLLSPERGTDHVIMCVYLALSG